MFQRGDLVRCVLDPNQTVMAVERLSVPPNDRSWVGCKWYDLADDWPQSPLIVLRGVFHVDGLVLIQEAISQPAGELV